MEESYDACDEEEEDEGNHDVTEETVVTIVFSQCDTEGIGRVHVSKLIQFMISSAGHNLDGSTLEDLQVMLDPQGCDAEVTRQAFGAAMKCWTQQLKNNNNINVPCTGEQDNSNTNSPLDDRPLEQSSPAANSVQLDIFNVSNISSYSCGGSEIIANCLNNEGSSVQEQVLELKHMNKRLEDANRDLQNQLHISEDSYAVLQSDYENVCHKMSSLQAAVKQVHQLQKECEELKEEIAAMEQTKITFGLQVQQLEKQVLTQKQQMSLLENQKVELSVELEVSERRNQETQKIMTVQKIQIEDMLKQCGQHTNKNEQQAVKIVELQAKMEDYVNMTKHLKEEKQALESRLVNAQDELLSLHSQSSVCLAKKSSVWSESVTSEDENYVSACSSLFLPTDRRDSLQAEIQAVLEASDKTTEFSRSAPSGSSSLDKLQELEQERELQNMKLDFLEKEYQEALQELDRLKEELHKSESCLAACQCRGSQSSDSSVAVDQAAYLTHVENADKEVQCLWSRELHSRGSQTICTALHCAATQTSTDCCANLSEPRRKKQRTQSSLTVIEEAADSTSDTVEVADREELFVIFNPVTALAQWEQDTDALVAARRKTNLQVRPGALVIMERLDASPETDTMPALSCSVKRTSLVDLHRMAGPVASSTPEVVQSSATFPRPQRTCREQDSSPIRRSLSESQVVAAPEGSSVSSVSSEASSSSGLLMSTGTEVFPSLPDVVLQQLGLCAVTRPSEVLSEQDIENRFSALTLAFKTDKLTITSRHERQQRHRDQAEKNMANEVMKLKAAISNLNYLCRDSESIEILGKIQDQVDVLQRSTEMVSSSAEIYGAVQQENRVSKAIEVMLTHVENLKRMYEKEHAELEETKRVLTENNIVVEGNIDTADAVQNRSTPRYRSLVSLVGSGKRGRRASIAAFARPLGSSDSAKGSTSSLTFGESKNYVRTMNTRRPSSLLHLESLAPGWDRTDRLDRPDIAGASMDNIKEMVEGRHDSAASLEQSSGLQNRLVEENNNCKGPSSRKSSYCDGPPELGCDDIGDIYDDLDIPGGSPDLIDNFTQKNISLSFTGRLTSLRSVRECATDLVSQTRTAVVDCVVPLDVDCVLIQIRRCATVILLFMALWSLVSTFVPTNAQSRDCVPFSWYTLEELLRPYTQLRHYGPPPT